MNLLLGSLNSLVTHFVSKQESYFTYTEDATPSPVDHDVHFRPGIGVGGIETYTPRALLYDLKGRRGVGKHDPGNSADKISWG